MYRDRGLPGRRAMASTVDEACSDITWQIRLDNMSCGWRRWADLEWEQIMVLELAYLGLNEQSKRAQEAIREPTMKKYDLSDGRIWLTCREEPFQMRRAIIDHPFDILPLVWCPCWQDMCPWQKARLRDDAILPPDRFLPDVFVDRVLPTMDLTTDARVPPETEDARAVKRRRTRLGGRPWPIFYQYRAGRTTQWWEPWVDLPPGFKDYYQENVEDDGYCNAPRCSDPRWRFNFAEMAAMTPAGLLRGIRKLYIDEDMGWPYNCC